MVLYRGGGNGVERSRGVSELVVKGARSADVLRVYAINGRLNLHVFPPITSLSSRRIIGDCTIGC